MHGTLCSAAAVPNCCYSSGKFRTSTPVLGRYRKSSCFSVARKSATSGIRDNLVAEEKDACERGSVVKINEGEGNTNSNVL